MGVLKLLKELETRRCTGAYNHAVFIAGVSEAMGYTTVEAVGISGGKCLHRIAYRDLQSSLQDNAPQFVKPLHSQTFLRLFHLPK